MKIQHYVLIFLALCFGLFVFYRFQNQLGVRYQKLNTEYSQALTSACYDAAKTINTSNLSDTDGVWKNEGEMKHTLDVFYETLARNFGSSINDKKEALKEKTPFVFLVDIDGFYVSFNGIYDDFGNAEVAPGYDGQNVITPINTWTEKRGSSTVRYYLNDYVKVTASDNRLYQGDRVEVYNELSSAGVLTSELAYLNNEPEFDECKHNVINTKLEEQLNYYVNTQLPKMDRYYAGYNLTLSFTEGEDWSRMIKNPCVISFLQGPQKHLGGKLYNVYAFAGGEMTNKAMYFIEGNHYYPYDGNVQATTSTVLVNGVPVEVTTYTHNGIPVDNCYTMEQCALLGATPGY